jgi:uncharacterized membrane protein (UPF0127 family)
MSRRKEALSWLSVIFVLLIVGAAALYILWPQMQPHATLRVGDGVFKAQVARTNEARAQGLSNTATLRSDQAMIMVYGKDDEWAVWMKDMNYPIDIVWLDKDKKVVHIVKNAPPESYPYEQFTPKKEARYVLELPAGTVGNKSIVIGGQATFDENNLERWP